MKLLVRPVTCAAISLLCAAFSNAQTITLSGATDPSVQRREIERRNDADLDRRMKVMADLDRSSRTRGQRPTIPSVPEPLITKEVRERVNSLRRIPVSEAAPFAELLKSDKAGILKIFPYLDCITDKLIRIDAECTDFVPLSSSFSFRSRAYIDSAYEDIHLAKGRISNTGFFTQAAFVELGETDIAKIGLDDQRLIALSVFADKDVTINNARNTADKLAAGFQVQGVPLSASVKPSLGQSYAVRVIAYRLGQGVPPPSQKSTMTELRFLSLAADKREDVTVVFKVINSDDRGGLTILWHELSSKDAPKLKVSKGEVPSDFR